MASILIVDDVSANRASLVQLLIQDGHRLFEAGNGRDALDIVHAEHPDLVITDVLMPVMDGYEFVRRLRLDPATSRIRVVFYTAHYGAREARALAQSSDVSSVLTKPAGPDEVLRVVNRVLSGESETENQADASALTTELDREHLRLLTHTLSETTDNLRTANARLRALINVGLELASERDPDRLLKNVCLAVRDVFGATYVTVGIVDLANRTVRHVVSCGIEAVDWIKPGDRMAGIFGTVVDERRALRGDHADSDAHRLRFPVPHPEVQAFVAAPIASPTQVYGWICLVGNEGRSFTDDDEHLVMALSGQVGRIYEGVHVHAIAKMRGDALEKEVAERKQAEETLRHERDRTQRYLDAADVILLALDLEGRVTLVNRKGCDILEWHERELLGQDFITTCRPERIREDMRDRLRRVLAGEPSTAENLVTTRRGEERLIEWRNTLLRDDNGQVIGTLSSGTDITERRLLEERYQQAQKMEALGQLAGGVAHDFNNLLTGILLYCDLLLAEVDPDCRRQNDVIEIRKAATSASALTRQLLAFSRKQIIQPTLLDLNVVVTDMRSMLERLIAEDVRVVLNLQSELGRVKADRAQVEQILMNLALNARDAMPNGGTLTIETARVELDEGASTADCAVIAGCYVALTVTDTGTGMTPQVLAHLFEPFFTTKEPGKGTGLGLPTVHGIATRSGGSVNVYSEVGRGTAIKVYLPIVETADADGQAEAVEAVIKAPAAVAVPRVGGETVLVVEDADGLRELTRRLLLRQGYAVRVAGNAEEAVRQFDQHSDIDVLLTDVVMPGRSGPELTRQLAERWPALRVVYMSGYTQEAIVGQGVVDPGIAFLHKPFTSEALGRKIREALERSQPTS